MWGALRLPLDRVYPKSTAGSEAAAAVLEEGGCGADDRRLRRSRVFPVAAQVERPPLLPKAKPLQISNIRWHGVS